MGDSKTFSLRIVSLDYYMASPIPGLDIAYSSFHGGKVNEVPVIRIYGSTPAGQKTCLHIHRVLPYLYVPCADIPVQSQDQGDAYTHKISLAVEKALQLKSKASSKRQYVHGCSLVRGKKFYGYHSSEELFLQIYLYYPHDVSRAANLLLSGGVLGTCLQPHEAHIPFILQFLVDYNLYGMGHIHLSTVKFRYPVPDVFFSKRSVTNKQSKQNKDPVICRDLDPQANTSGNSSFDLPVWISSTIPADWNPGFNSMKRQSLCHLEGDSSVNEILNQQSRTYTSLSQTRSDVKMVQSLVPMWEEEYERTGVKETELLSDPSKPLPDDVLKTLSSNPEFVTRLLELHKEAESPLRVTPLDKDIRPMVSLKKERNLVVLDHISHNATPESDCSIEKCIHGSLPSQEEENVISSAERIANVNISCSDEHRVTQMMESLDEKADKEALNLLKWLASSQAEDDINSDDELLCETILSPFLPTNTLEEVLNIANTNYESESQKECQEILDSIHDYIVSKEENDRDNLSAIEKSPGSSYQKIISLVDGMENDIESTPDGLTENISKIKPDNGFEAGKHPALEDSLDIKEAADAQSCFTHKNKRKNLLWGSLPLSTNKIVYQLDPVRDCTETESPISRNPLFASNVEHESSTMKNLKETAPLVEGSVRDLMRRKRKYRVESVQCSSNRVENIPFEVRQREETNISARLHQNSPMFQQNKPDKKKPHQSISVHTPSTSHSMYHDQTDVEPPLDGKVPVFQRSENSLNGCEPGVGNNCFHKTKSGYIGSSGSSDAYLRSLQADPGNLGFETTISPCKSGQEPVPRLLESDNEHKTCDKGVHSRNVGAQSSLQSFVGHEGSVAESGNANQLSSEWAHEMSFNKPQSTSANMIIDVTKLNNGPYQEGEALAITFNQQDEDLVGVPVCGKDTATNWIDETPRRASSCHADSDIPCDEPSGRDVTLKQEAIVDIPTLYQNDGSYLYMLSPKISPPTAENVKTWLSNVTSVEDTAKFLSVNGTSRAPIGLLSSSPNDCNKVSPESRSTCHQQHLQPSKSQENCGNISIGNFNHNNDTVMWQGEEHSVHVKPRSDSSQEISQISGPAGKSKATPLSQTGFRDPASVGGGQQLTLLSIEIQAGSRGDLRPDPRFDAINIIILAIQNDDNYDVDVHLLLHSEGDDSHRDLNGIIGCNVLNFCEEKSMFDHFIKFVCSLDPDIIMGWDVQGGSLGFLAERASNLGVGLLNCISRTPSETKIASGEAESPVKLLDEIIPDPAILEDTVISDEWGRTHASGVHVGGRIVLNVWRLMRGELNLYMYTIEAVADALLRRKVPCISNKTLTKWFLSGPARARYRCIEYVINKAKLNLELMNQLDMINRTSELARVFGIDFFSVLSRGSQYRVESMYLRLAHTQNFLSISPGSHQVAAQPAMECLPLVMEPESSFYADPVVVLDFQSLYPSMIIAYNLCYSTCLGNIAPSKENVLGVTSFSPDPHSLQELKDQILLTPNGVMFVPSKVRKGVLPRLLEEILSTRIMVKQAMKKLSSSQQVLHRIFNARQMALKLIANVTYGYTAAGFSGRMPCAELADSIVQCGRRTLEMAISFVNSQEKWKARVIYGDTDSMFVLLKGRSAEDAFRIGNEIASEITAMNPNPVVLKMEKVYRPCFLLTKKRYVGYSYESPNQPEPVFDAKGIETVRRDTCRAVSKTMEQSLRTFFEHQDISEIKVYLQRQWKRILSGRVSLQDFVFAKEVRLGSYSTRESSSLPPAAIVASKAMKTDPRAEPRYGDRIPYVVVHGQPGARLVDMVVDPLELLALGSPYRLNDLYYITKQIIPALQRVFGLVGAELYNWFLEMPHTVREAFGKRPIGASNPQRTRIDFYYLSKHCMLCGDLVEASTHLCRQCSRNEIAAVIAVVGRTSKLETEMQHLAAICRHCGGGDWVVESGVKCKSLACSVFFERCKIQKELRGLASVAAEKDLYPKCTVEWF